MKLPSTRKVLITAGVATAAFLGSAGVVSALGRSHSNSPAATTDTGVTGASGSSTPKSNEDPTHEAGESAQREADENAGRGFGPGDGDGDHGGGRARADGAESGWGGR